MGNKLKTSNISGIKYSTINPIHNPKGNILHALKKSDDTFSKFGEAYFTSIHKSEVKGWKKHKLMIMNLFVPSGEVTFFLHDEVLGITESYKTGEKDYGRLTVPAGVWVAFRGELEKNLILNIASIEHDPNESEDKDISSFSLEESS